MRSTAAYFTEAVTTKKEQSLKELIPEIPREEHYRVRRKNRRYRLRQSCGREPSGTNVIKPFMAVMYKCLQLARMCLYSLVQRFKWAK